jgi:hypothetical protein
VHGEQQWLYIYGCLHTRVTLCTVVSTPPSLHCVFDASLLLLLVLSPYSDSASHRASDTLDASLHVLPVLLFLTRYMPDAGLYGNSSMYTVTPAVADFAACIAACDGWGSPSAASSPKPGTYCQWLTVSSLQLSNTMMRAYNPNPLHILCRKPKMLLGARKTIVFHLNPCPFVGLLVLSCSMTMSMAIARSATLPSRCTLGE